MVNSDLKDILGYGDASRENRLKAATWVLEHPEYMPELLRVTMEPYEELSIKASWTLEFVYLEDPELIWRFLDYFFENIDQPSNDSIVRPLSHICECICISNYKKQEPVLQKVFSGSHKEKLISIAFDWLITDQKVACQVRAMTCLFYLGTEFDWIHQELEEILQRNIPAGSAGYRSRAAKTLDEIRKFRYK